MISINLTSPVPIYAQLRNQIIEAIAKEEIGLGQPMPSVRQLAEDLGINPMTVNKTYGQLKHEGYLETNLRQGAMVKEKIQPKADFLAEIEEDLRLLIAQAILQGIPQAEFMAKIQQIYQEFPAEKINNQAQS